MNRDNQAFLDYHAKPTSQALVELLRVHQDRIYNLCFQVLRHAQDAEDAAQEVLIETLSGVGSIRDPGAFHVWLYRVCLHTALNHKERRVTRLAVAVRRSEMNSPVSPESKDEIRGGILNGLAQLDDHSRALVIEHYFEKRTLEELAHREGVSAVAVWKRIEKAKDRLRQILVGTGCVVLAPSIAEALEAVPPVAAPATLLGQSILSKAALVAAGGITVGAKTAISATSIVLAFLLLGLGLAGGLLIRRQPAGEDSGKIRALEAKVAKLSTDLEAARRPLQPFASRPESTPLVSEPESENLAPAEQLKNRLAQFKAWRQKANEDRKANSKKLPDYILSQWTSNEAAQRWRSGHLEQLKGLRSLIISAPGVFVDFVKDSANADCVSDLLQFTLGNPSGGGGWITQKYSDFPPELLDGLHSVLVTGTAEVQLELLQLFNQIQEPPGPYLERYRSLLASAEPGVRSVAASLLCRDRRARPEDLAVVQELAVSPYYKFNRSGFMEALAMNSLPESETWFLAQIESTQDDDLAGYLIRSMGRRAMFQLTRADSLERVAAALPRFLDRRQEDLTQWAILEVTAYLPADKIPGILDRYLASATNEACRRAATRLAEMVRDGERRPVWLFQAVAEIQENPRGRR